MLEVGKLYLCEDYSLLLYKDPETAADTCDATGAVAIATAPSASTARADAAAADPHLGRWRRGKDDGAGRSVALQHARGHQAIH